MYNLNIKYSLKMNNLNEYVFLLEKFSDYYIMCFWFGSNWDLSEVINGRISFYLYFD